MKRKSYIVFPLIILICAFEAPRQSVEFNYPEYWPKPVYEFSKNELTKEKVELGRVLFYDPVLSRDSSISCASCHSPYTAFAHVDHALSHGVNDRIGNRNAPALMNLAWQRNFMWDGAVNHLDMQPLAPISNPLEMDEDLNHVFAKLKRRKLYPALFESAFGDTAITGERFLKAMSQFMLSIVSCHSKYDSVKLYLASFSEQELRGYALFKNNCSSCHSEPLFSNYQFENNGLQVDTTINDYGRMKISKLAKDSLMFKVPTLRNIEYSSPYMHDGRFKTLSQVLQHYTSSIQRGPTLSEQLKNPIRLTSNDKVDLIAFLLTLSDRKFLFDERYAYPKQLLPSH